MAEIDEVKEILNSLRVAMSITIGLLVVLVGAIIRMERDNQIDVFFYIGIAMAMLLLVAFFKIVISLRQNIRKIKDL
jgi:glucan phosphoethanolaminetransferase (alkaline phosphatase superfamily)